MHETGADSLADMLDERQRLLEIALWMFGSTATAEWILQETYRRWYTLDDDERAGIPLARAWLTRVTGEICLELLATDRAPAEISPAPHVVPPAATSDPVTHNHVARRFASACDVGDVAALASLLATDAVVVCDGGGKVRAPVRPIRGAAEVARFVAALLTCQPGTVLAVEPVNDRTGLALRRGGRAVAVVSMSVAATEVTAVWIVLNPDKLHRWHRLS